MYRLLFRVNNYAEKQKQWGQMQNSLIGEDCLLVFRQLLNTLNLHLLRNI